MTTAINILFPVLAIAWLIVFWRAKRHVDSRIDQFAQWADPQPLSGSIHWTMSEDTIGRICVGESSVTLLDPAMKWRLRETHKGTWIACHCSIDHSGEWPDLKIAQSACEREHTRLMEQLVEMETAEIGLCPACGEKSKLDFEMFVSVYTDETVNVCESCWTIGRPIQ